MTRCGDCKFLKVEDNWPSEPNWQECTNEEVDSGDAEYFLNIFVKDQDRDCPGFKSIYSDYFEHTECSYWSTNPRRGRPCQRCDACATVGDQKYHAMRDGD